MENLQRAQFEADTIDHLQTNHPAYQARALRGILHALLALHEQNEPKPATKRPTTPKEPK